MARLNEAPLASDPLEILRRKFLRQNRDIARVNSTQSMRIRSLENEISRLLAENLEYREQILHLQGEAAVNNSKALVNHISSAKAELEFKLQEINALVARLGSSPKRTERPTEEYRPEKITTFRSPDEKKWRNMCAMSEEVAAQEGRLPPILENKTYPRRTLDQKDIAATAPGPDPDLLNVTDSPDIGPPPVSQFVNEEPLKIDLPISSVPDRDDICDINTALSVNLEQRRKRKDSIGNVEKKRASRFEPQVQQAGQSLKVGAKRKMSMRDEEDGSQTVAQPMANSPDEFKYTRRSVGDKVRTSEAISSAQSTQKTLKGLSNANTTPLQRRTNTLSARKALGSKSTNVDVRNSPKKNGKNAGDAKLLREGLDVKLAKNNSRESRQTSVLNYSSPKPTTVTVDTLPESREQEPEPESDTPLATPSTTVAENPEPFSSQPSTVRAASRDTPPPQDIGSSSDGHRPSRRARASVSYVEPNLRDKMRRPTVQLVDAVTGEGKSQKHGITTYETNPPTTAVKIKGEPGLDESWKNMPAALETNVYAQSPLISKTAVPELSIADEAGHEHRGMSTVGPDGVRQISRSGSGSVISALIAGQRKIKQERKNDGGPTDGDIENDMAKLDIFEFTGSPPPEDSKVEKSADAEIRECGKGPRKTSSESRNSRHSSNGGVSETEMEPAYDAATSRGRRSTLGLPKPRPQINQQVLKMEGALRRTNSRRDSAASTENGDMRSERAAGRRRSMML